MTSWAVVFAIIVLQFMVVNHIISDHDEPIDYQSFLDLLPKTNPNPQPIMNESESSRFTITLIIIGSVAVPLFIFQKVYFYIQDSKYEKQQAQKRYDAIPMISHLNWNCFCKKHNQYHSDFINRQTQSQKFGTVND
jgi:hypothetical protein